MGNAIPAGSTFLEFKDVLFRIERKLVSPLGVSITTPEHLFIGSGGREVVVPGYCESRFLCRRMTPHFFWRTNKVGCRQLRLGCYCYCTHIKHFALRIAMILWNVSATVRVQRTLSGRRHAQDSRCFSSLRGAHTKEGLWQLCEALNLLRAGERGQMTAADVLIETLIDWGVTAWFSLPGDEWPDSML